MRAEAAAARGRLYSTLATAASFAGIVTLFRAGQQWSAGEVPVSLANQVALGFFFVGLGPASRYHVLSRRMERGEGAVPGETVRQWALLSAVLLCGGAAVAFAIWALARPQDFPVPAVLGLALGAGLSMPAMRRPEPPPD